jgi:large subunit ribosomal protein L10
MPTQQKIETVADLKDRLERATVIVSTEYRGLTVKEMQDLRRKLREGGLEVRVVKNTLLKRAADDAGQSGIVQIIEGPTALAISYGDPIEAAKAVTGYAQGAPTAFGVRGAFMDGSVLSESDIKALTTVPPRPVLLGQFMGALQGPLANFVGLLDAPLQELSGLLNSLLSEFPGLVEARAKQMETTG